MFELNITHFVESECPSDYSASVAEIGKDAGSITWQAAQECEIVLIHKDEEIQETKEFFASFGAWDYKEIAAWSDKDVNALLIQFISGDMREGNTDRLFTTENKQTYYYIGE